MRSSVRDGIWSFTSFFAHKINVAKPLSIPERYVHAYSAILVIGIDQHKDISVTKRSVSSENMRHFVDDLKLG